MKKQGFGCVYFFRHKGLAAVKIGFSNSPDHTKRLSVFETYSPHGVDVLAVIIIKNPSSVESIFHKKFANKRLNGEWFDLVESEIDDALELIKTFEDESYAQRFTNTIYEDIELHQFVKLSLLKGAFFNRKKAAEKYGVSRQTIHNLIKKYK